MVLSDHPSSVFRSITLQDLQPEQGHRLPLLLHHPFSAEDTNVLAELNDVKEWVREGLLVSRGR